MTLLSQQHSGLASGGNEGFPCGGALLRSHSAFSRLQNGFNSLASLWTAWNFREEIFSSSNDMGNIQGGAFANNLNRPVPPSKFAHNAPQRILRRGV